MKHLPQQGYRGEQRSVVYFAANDYEEELRAGGRIGSNAELLVGERAWKLILERELGVKVQPRGSDVFLPYASSFSVGRISVTSGGGTGFSGM